MKLLNISITNWGPYRTSKSFKFDIGLNLFYADNETGKTTLMEAMISALTGSPSVVYPGIRVDEEFVGSAVLTLENKGKRINLTFPARRRKKRISSQDSGLMAKLLFSWPTEADDPEMVSQLLTGLLFPSDILGWNPLEGTGVMEVHEGQVNGRRVGLYKRAFDIEKQLKTLRRLEREFYSFSEVSLLRDRDELLHLEEELNHLLLQKRALAGRLFSRLKELQKQISALDIDKVTEAEQVLARIGKLEAMLERRRKDLPDISDEQLVFVDGLIKALENLPSRKRRFPSLVLYLGLLLGIGAMFFPSIVVKLMGAGLILSSVLFLIYGKELKYYQAQHEAIFKKASDYFERGFDSLEELREYRDYLARRITERRVIEDDIRSMELDLSQELRYLNGLTAGQNARSFIEEYYRRRKELEAQLCACQEELSRLGVSEADMVFDIDSTEVVYDQTREQDMVEKIGKIKERLTKEESRINSLKTAIVSAVGCEYTDNIKRIFVELKNHQIELEEELRQIAARILGGAAWARVLSRSRQEQFEKVSQLIMSSRFIDYLSLFTLGRYNSASVRVGKDDIWLISEEGEYRLSCLSSGARQQVLFAFKAALIEQLYEEPAFLLLDDVFIFSDALRLRKQVQLLLSLVQSGWQIIYLTSSQEALRAFSEAGIEARIISS